MFKLKSLIGLAAGLALLGGLTLSVQSSIGLSAPKQSTGPYCGIKVVNLDPGYGAGRQEMRYVCDDTP
jgi:1,4-dihydroxy-2-naphthoyl-CoA synthase